MNVEIYVISPYGEVGKIIQAKRKALGLSQTDLAQAVGVNRDSVRRLEAGLRMQVDYWEMMGYQKVLGKLSLDGERLGKAGQTFNRCHQLQHRGVGAAKGSE